MCVCVRNPPIATNILIDGENVLLISASTRYSDCYLQQRKLGIESKGERFVIVSTTDCDGIRLRLMMSGCVCVVTTAQLQAINTKIVRRMWQNVHSHAHGTSQSISQVDQVQLAFLPNAKIFPIHPDPRRTHTDIVGIVARTKIATTQRKNGDNEQRPN